MTQNKKFKKQVRARMEETGETYVQARRSLFDEQKVSSRRERPLYRLIGYWRSVEEPHWPDPIDMVDASWDADERARVAEHLRDGHVAAVTFGGSWCRLGCSRHETGPRTTTQTFFEARGTHDPNLSVEERREARRRASAKAQEADMTGEKVVMGSRELTDGVYVWPEGLVHYIEKHNVRLPRQFVEHVLRGSHASLPDGPEGHEFDRDRSWWLGLGQLRRQVAEQRMAGDSLGLMYDAESWAALGGSEEDRQETLRDARRLLDGAPRILEIQTPFNAGWYFHHSGYPEEGSQGPYHSLDDARQAARLAGLDADDPDEVTFVEQERRAAVVRRFAVEHLRKSIARRLLARATDRWDEEAVRRAIEEMLVGVLREETRKLERAGVTTPPENDVEMTMDDVAEEERRQGIVRASVVIERPEKYPEFVRELAEMGLVDPRYLISVEFKP